jgi:hypothetical protein
MHDTSPQIEQRMAHMLATRTPTERLRMAGSMFTAGKMLLTIGLQREYGPLNQAQLRVLLLQRLYSDCFSPAELQRIMQSMPDMQPPDE